MKGYSQERKEAVLKKMLPPHSRSIPELAEEEGIAAATLYLWRKQARAQGRLLPDGDTGAEGWSSADKFAAVLETASLNEAELAEYCRRRGLYSEQVKGWRVACEQANAWDKEHSRRVKETRQQDRRRLRELERELKRKDKALAEAAALLVLRKKAEAIWGEDEVEWEAARIAITLSS